MLVGDLRREWQSDLWDEQQYIPGDDEIILALTRIPYDTVTQAINKKYFGGHFTRLPRVVWSFERWVTPDWGTNILGEYKKETHTIFLYLKNIVLARKPVTAILTHELIHAMGIDGHGPDFRKWVRLIAAAGLPVSLGCDGVVFYPGGTALQTTNEWRAKQKFNRLFIRTENV